MNTDQATFDGFVDDPPPAPAGPPPIVIDRSTLERWATCPHQAALVAAGYASTGSADADAGNEVHAVLARAVAERADGATAAHLRDLIEQGQLASRPDVQPDVCAAVRRWPLVELLTRREDGAERAPEDLLRFDGGTGPRSGQLAADLIPADDGRPAVRLTCEVDVLVSTVSRERVRLIDWKSGRKWWTPTDVRESFQFQFYAELVFRTYPAVRTVEAVVFMTREGRGTDVVEFVEADRTRINARLRAAADIYLAHRDVVERERAAENPNSVMGTVPAWPTPEKCAICPAVRVCTLAHRPANLDAVDPEGAVRQLVVLEEAAARIRGQLSARVRATGADLVYGEGKERVAFGVGKPKQQRAATCDLY